jgi:hypothetical protein
MTTDKAGVALSKTEYLWSHPDARMRLASVALDAPDYVPTGVRAHIRTMFRTLLAHSIKPDARARVFQSGSS